MSPDKVMKPLLSAYPEAMTRGVDATISCTNSPGTNPPNVNVTGAPGVSDVSAINGFFGSGRSKTTSSFGGGVVFTVVVVVVVTVAAVDVAGVTVVVVVVTTTGAIGLKTTGSDARPLPIAFNARIFTEYSAPLVNPAITSGPVVIAGDAAIQLEPPSVEYS